MNYESVKTTYSQSLALLKSVDKKTYNHLMKYFKIAQHERLSALMACFSHQLKNQPNERQDLSIGFVKNKNQFFSIGIYGENGNLYFNSYTKDIFGKNNAFALVISGDDLSKVDEENTTKYFASVITNKGSAQSTTSTYSLDKEGKGYVVRKYTNDVLVAQKHKEELEEENSILTTPYVGY